MKNKKLKKQLLIWLAVFGSLSIPFWLVPNLDIELIKPFYKSEQGFFLKLLPFWDFIYTYGIFLAYILVAVALIVLSVSYWNKHAIKWRKPAVFLILAMLVGPGLLVNATFKDHWGRPRPREIKEFGGQHQYVKLWVKGKTNGKSFPSGHASTAFFMSIPFLFLIRRYKKWAWVFFIFGTLYGLLMSFTRLIAGGHFASDSLWAAGMVWLSAIVLYHVLKLDNEAKKQKQLNKKGTGFVLIGIVMPILVITLLFATPYVSNNKVYSPQKTDFTDYNTKMVLANLQKGDVNIHFADSFFVRYSVLAFGFPNSKVNWAWQPADTSIFSFVNSGLFTTVKTNADVYFDSNSYLQNSINLQKGDININLDNDSLPTSLTINLQNGNVNILANKQANINLQTSANILNKSILNPIATTKKLKINIHKKGMVTFYTKTK